MNMKFSPRSSTAVLTDSSDHSCPSAAEEASFLFSFGARWRKIGRMFLAALFGLGMWQYVAFLVQNLRQIHFPTPLDCFWGLVQMLGGVPFLEHSIYSHVAASGGRWLTGFGLAWIFAVGWAFLAYWYPLFKSISKPTVEVLQLVPGLAWVPVVILVFGLGQEATVAIIILTTFPVVALSAGMGFESSKSEHICMGLACGYGFWGLLRTVYLPGALPHVLSGTRIALGVSWRVLVAAEMVVGSGEGLGYAIIQSRWTMDYVSAFACIVIIAVVGLAIERLLLLPLEKRTLRRWGLNHEHM